MFCRNCGKSLNGTPEICQHCGFHPVKATSFCRYCGHATSAEDLVCSRCGAVTRPIPGSAKAVNQERQRLIKLGKIINLSIVGMLIALYIIYSLPEKVTEPIKAVVSDAVLSTTGYTALPLHSLSAAPPVIPPQRAVENFYMPQGTNVNATHQLTIYAVYRNVLSSDAQRLEDVTTKATYRSSDEGIATVTPDGLVRALALGSATITVSYTAIPGSANFSAASDGKTPITVTVTVPVLVSGPAVGAAVAPAPGP